MIEINLLPKDFRKSSGAFSFGKTGLYLVAAAAGVILVLGAVTFYQIQQLDSLKADIDRANQRAELLRSDIRVVDALTDVKAKIHNRIEAVEKLDRHRSAWVRILEDVSRNVPEFVWLDKFQEKALPKPKPAEGNQADGQKKEAAPQPTALPSQRPIEMQGYAFTLNALAATMIHMMRSDYFENVELVESKDTLYAGEKAYKFQLAADVHYLSDEELRNLANKSEDNAKAKTSHASLN